MNLFLILPLTIIFFASLGIGVVIWRKKSYLNKLYAINTAGDEEGAAVLASSGFFWLAYGGEFFPEIKLLLEKVNFHQHKAKWLIETEKVLRRTRVISLKIDRVSDTLIKKIRRIHKNDQLNGRLKSSDQEAANEKIILTSSIQPNEAISVNFLKNEEERLIIEIAKNPKDPALYEKLGDLYTEMGNVADAQESYKASLELNPSSELVQQKLTSSLGKIA